MDDFAGSKGGGLISVAMFEWLLVDALCTGENRET